MSMRGLHSAAPTLSPSLAGLTGGHDDPADRFIAATAMVHGLALVTADRSLLRCPDIEVLPGA